MANEIFREQPDTTRGQEAWSGLSGGEGLEQGTDPNTLDGGQLPVEPYDPIETLLAEMQEELARPPVSRIGQLAIPHQPRSSRQEVDHIHHLIQEAEFHPDFKKRSRSEIVAMMLAEEARQREAALHTPDLPYTPSYKTDENRVAAYIKRKIGKEE